MPQVKMPDGAVVEMPDTLTPELATRLKALRDSQAPAKPPEPARRATNSEILGGLASGTASNVVDIARGAAAGAISFPGEMSKLLQKGSNKVDEIYGRPPGMNEKTWMPEYEGTLKAMPRLGTKETPETKGYTEMGGAVAPVPGSGAIKGVGKAAGLGADAYRGVSDLLRGTEAAAARQSAMQASRAPLSQAASGFERDAVDASGRARQADSALTVVQRNLDEAAKRGAVPDLHEQGNTVRQAYQTVMQQADNARKRDTQDLYQAAQKAAASREAAGARINIAPATASIKNLLDTAENIPPLKAKLQTLLGAVEGRAPEVPTGTVGSGKVTSKMKLPAPPAPAGGLTYQELDLANRYIKDIAYSADLEGYGSVVRNAALDLSKKLEKQIVEFVPEHAQAAAKYRELSKPMETLGTKYGKALTATRGGVSNDAYEVVAAQQLPDRLFGTRAGVEAVVDALAGGKEGAERAAAQAQVDRMVENWVLSKSTGKVGEDASKMLEAQGMRPTLAAVPDAAKRLSATFEGEAKMGRMGENLQAQGKMAAQTADQLKKQRDKVQGLLKDADALSKANSPKYQKQAFDEYVASMRSMVKSNDLPLEKFNAALALLDRAETLQAKTEKARKMAMLLAKGAGIGVAAGVGVPLIQHAIP